MTAFFDFGPCVVNSGFRIFDIGRHTFNYGFRVLNFCLQAPDFWSPKVRFSLKLLKNGKERVGAGFDFLDERFLFYITKSYLTLR
jgi:hypothetical protein